MKIYDVLLEYEEEREDIINDIWDNHYFNFNENTYEELIDLLKNENVKKKLQDHFYRYNDFKVSENNYDSLMSYSNNILDEFENSGNNQKVILDGLKNFEQLIHELIKKREIFNSFLEMSKYDETIDDTLEGRKNIYGYYGVSRGDF
jgi:uncharacterized membrane protein YheB (UPF0754 family)